MNQLTTIASLPSGAGQAAHLNPEIGRAREVEKAEEFSFCDECETCSTCLKTGCLPVIGPDMLDAAL